MIEDYKTSRKLVNVFLKTLDKRTGINKKNNSNFNFCKEPRL